VTNFKSLSIKYCNAGVSGNPPPPISALWNIGILLHKKATRAKLLEVVIFLSLYYLSRWAKGQFYNFIFISDHYETICSLGIILASKFPPQFYFILQDTFFYTSSRIWNVNFQLVWEVSNLFWVLKKIRLGLAVFEIGFLWSRDLLLGVPLHKTINLMLLKYRYSIRTFSPRHT
jgi:hypothetical protein